MQLYVPAALLTLWLARPHARGELAHAQGGPAHARGWLAHARRSLALLVLLACVFNGVLAYAFDWKSIMYFAYPRYGMNFVQI